MRCKHCKTKFEPIRFNQKYCMQTEQCTDAAIKFSLVGAKKIKKKAWIKKKKKIKSDLKTKQDYEKDLQEVFNTFIRIRDKGGKCISCSRPLQGKYDAGHYYPAGSYKGIRFDEDNVHGQCVHCNRDKHGNLQEYREGLIKRIGESRLVNLDKERLIKKHITIPELIELKEYYKLKIKEWN